MEVLKIFELFYRNKVRYLICGGLAMNVYGIPRMTADIDLLLDFEIDNLKAFEKVLNSLGYTSLLPIDIKSLNNISERKNLREEKNLVAFSYYNHQSNQMAIDVLIDIPFSFEAMYERRVIRKSSDYEINLTSVNDMIKLKELAGRSQDISDIKMLNQYLKNESN